VIAVIARDRARALAESETNVPNLPVYELVRGSKARKLFDRVAQALLPVLVSF
jgi:hypothetical protein